VQSRREILRRLCCVASAFDDVEGEAGQRGFFVAGLHVEAGLVHGGDDLVEGEFVVA
jgi:hypothetical protein